MIAPHCPHLGQALEPLICFLSPRLFLFWTHQINGMTQHVVFSAAFTLRDAPKAVHSERPVSILPE